MIKKLKSSSKRIKKAAAIGFTLAALFSSNANTQQINLPEREAERIISNQLKKEKIEFRMNRLLSLRTREGLLYLKPDFQLRNRVIIECWSQEDEQDSEYKKNAYERYKVAIEQDLNTILDMSAREWFLRGWLFTERDRETIIFNYLNLNRIPYEIEHEKNSTILDPLSKIKLLKPLPLLDKKEIYEKCKGTGKEIYFIETKDIKEGISIEQEVDKILEQTTKKRTLREEEAAETISNYLKQKGINYKIKTTFKTNNIIIRPDFLLEKTAEKLPIAIEYYSNKDKEYQKRKEIIYKRYEQTGGKVYVIESNNKEETLSELEKIVNDIFPSSSLSTETSEPAKK